MRDDVLPKSWCATTLGEVIAQFVGGGTPPKNDPHNFSGNIPFMTVKDMNVRRPNDTIDHITQKALNGSSAKLVPADTLVIATRMGLGKIVRPTIDVAINQDLKAIFLSNHLEKSFIENWFIYKAPYLETEGTGTTVKGLRLEFLRDLSFPLAPLNEQTRIVDKIEQLFSNLDEGEALLKQVQKQLATYRQSVLKAAVTGELTKEWREANKHRLESGDALLKRILKARRDNWSGRGKYQEPEAPDISNLPEIPEEWTWASLNQLLANIEAGKSFRCLERPPELNEKGLVKISAVTWGVFNENESKTVTDESLVDERWLIKKGDFLFSRANTLELVGACVIVQHMKKHLFLSDKVLRFVFVTDVSEWTNTFLKSSFGRNQIEQLATGNQLSMRNISQESIRKICIPLYPEMEMLKINDLVTDIFSQIDALESWCASELTRSVTLRQSILKDAFSGKLVPQDPSDEPASELLKRIQAERAKTAKTTKQKSSATPRPRGRHKIKESV